MIVNTAQDPEEKGGFSPFYILKAYLILCFQ